MAGVVVEDHLELVKRAVLRFVAWGRRVGLTVDDLVQEGAIAIMRAAATNKPARGEFAGLAFVAVCRRVSRRLQREQGRWRHVQAAALDDGNGQAIDLLHEVEDRRTAEHASPEARELARRLLRQLHGQDRQVVECLFGFADGRPWTVEQLARHLGVSPQRVHQRLARALRKLRYHAGMPDVEDGPESAGDASAVGPDLAAEQPLLVSA